MTESLKKIMEEQKKSISVDDTPEKVDKKCPFTGGLKLRGKLFRGIVVSKDTHRTVIIEWNTRHFVRKYERFMMKKTKVAAHNPDVINANIGDEVIIAESRPLSKTKNFVIIKNLGHSRDYMIKKESIEDDLKIVDRKSSSNKVVNQKESKKDSLDEANKSSIQDNKNKSDKLDESLNLKSDDNSDKTEEDNQE